MTKRIVSGIFILTALGALGVILAGALTSGEQLIVRFLTAVIVAALGLYVISDLRLQADDDAAGVRPGSRPRLAGIDAPPNSTAAFMATVTGKADNGMLAELGHDIQDELADDDSTEPIEHEHREFEVGVGATSSSTSEPEESAVVEDAGSHDGPPVPSILGPAPVTVRASDLPDLTGQQPATITDLFSRRATAEADHASWPTSGEVAEVPVEATETATVAVAEADVRPAAPADTGTWSATEQPSMGEDGASADFEYSGELEAPAFEWPAPPDGPGNDGAEPIATGGEPGPDESVPEMGADEAELATGTTPETATVLDPTELMAADGPPLPPETDRVDETDQGFEIDQGIEIDAALDTELVADALDAEAEVGHDGGTETGANDTDEIPVTVNGNGYALPTPLLDRSELGGAEYADAPLAPIIDLRDVNPTEAGVDEAIKTGELEVISALIEQGMLSTDGPISDRDVRTMVYVAFTSNELRKLLLAGGTPDAPNPEIDLGPVELFDASMKQPPKTLYTGRPTLPAEARSQLG